MNTIESVKKNDCSGCTACVYICPEKAVLMRPDEQGFLYPFVDKDKCVGCGLCLKTHLEISASKNGVAGAYAAKSSDKNVLKNSSSGGVCAAIAEDVTIKGGVVYGVVFDEDQKVVTERFDESDDRSALYGSKYVQTDMRDSYEKCFADLKGGREAAFFGTSCHIAGLYAFLKEKKCDTQRLVTVDMICHGVPSPRIFADYIGWLKKDKGFKKFDFRTKEKPWGYGSKNFGSRITYLKKGKTINEIDSLKARVFLRLFFSNNCLREHCYVCPYAGTDKPADLTVADYWGCKEAEPEFFTEEGVSAVLVHTERGEKVLASIKNVVLKETTVEKITARQSNLYHPSVAADTKDEFAKLYATKGFLAIAKKYGGYTVRSRLKHFAFKLIGK